MIGFMGHKAGGYWYFVCHLPEASSAQQHKFCACVSRNFAHLHICSIWVQKYFRRNMGKLSPTKNAPYGNWERIDWTEMTGQMVRIFLAPSCGPFRLTKLPNPGY